MSATLNVVLPVFGLVALGYVAAWAGYLSSRVAEGLAAYVYNVAVPLLIFRAIVASEPQQAAPAAVIFSYYGAVAVVWLLAWLVGSKLFHFDGPRTATLGIGATFSNSVMLGLPLILKSFGDPGAVIFFILFPFHLPLLSLAHTVHAEFSRGASEGIAAAALATLKGVATNPIIVAIAAGVLVRVADLPVPYLAGQLIDPIADSAPGCALFAMGLTLRGYGIAEGARAAIAITVLKLLVQPALVFVSAQFVFGFDPLTVAVLTVFAAAPSGVNAFIHASRYNAGMADASSAIALSTALSVFTISAMLVLFGVG